MPAIDKAVSTEDLCAEEVPPVLGVLRLEAILNTLVENKVESLKQENGKPSSVHSSPKSILQKIKCHASPKATLKIEDEKKKDSKRRDKRDKGHKAMSESKQFKKQVLRQETSSPDSQILCEDDNHKYTGNGAHCRTPACLEPNCQSHLCYCSREHGPVPMHVNDDYTSIKMDGYGDVETDAIIAQEELRRARKKRRRRRKRRLKKRLALNPHLVDSFAHDHEAFKTLHDDELPPRAKWTIVATACLLLFMCLLLVGITLRMAPLIDEIGKLTAQLELVFRDSVSAKMSSTESVAVKNESSATLLCKNCSFNEIGELKPNVSSTFLTPPKIEDTLRRSSTSSHSSASDCGYPATPRLLLQSNKKLKKTASLEEIYIIQKKKLKKRKNDTRRKSEQIPRYDEIGIHRKSSSRKLRKKHSVRSKASRNSYGYNIAGDIEKGLVDVDPDGRPRLYSNTASIKSQNGAISKRLSRQPSVMSNKEQTLRQKRRKKIINIILAVYFLLFCVSILSVVITLTHRTTAAVCDSNCTKSCTYYTFSPHHKLCDDNS